MDLRGLYQAFCSPLTLKGAIILSTTYLVYGQLFKMWSRVSGCGFAWPLIRQKVQNGEISRNLALVWLKIILFEQYSNEKFFNSEGKYEVFHVLKKVSLLLMIISSLINILPSLEKNENA